MTNPAYCTNVVILDVNVDSMGFIKTLEPNVLSVLNRDHFDRQNAPCSQICYHIWDFFCGGLLHEYM